MSTTDLKSRLSKISANPTAKEVKQQSTMVRRVERSNKPGRKNRWKDESATYVRLYTQLQHADRNTLKSAIAGGRLSDKFESVDHFINEAIIRLMKDNGLNPKQNSTIV